MSTQKNTAQVNRVPVTIVAGFLGAGKTTLLNRILNGDHGLKIAVMVNDFGAINIDSQLVVSADQKTINLANGCICCTVENDLIEQLQTLLQNRDQRPEHILIETSGVSDPGKVVNTLRYPGFRQHLTIDAVISLADAEQFLNLEGDMKALAMSQLSVADLVVLNKLDRVNEQQLLNLREQWSFPGARIFETQYAEVPLALLLGVESERHVAHSTRACDHGCDQGTCSHTRPHDQLFKSLSWKSSQPLSLTKLRQIFKQLPTGIYRAKGFVYLQEAPDQRCVLQMVGTRTEIEKADSWKETPATQLVLIGTQSLDWADVRQQLESCIA